MAKSQALKEGDCVAVSLWPETAPNNCYIGLVEIADDYGVRINLVHWDDKVDMLAGYTESLFMPWENISSILISATERPTKRFITSIGPNWCTQIESMRKNEEPPKKKPPTKK